MFRTCMISPFGCTAGESQTSVQSRQLRVPDGLIAAAGAVERDRAYSRQLHSIGRAIESIRVDRASSLRLTSRLQNQLRDHVGLRDQGQVTCLYLDGLGSHPLGHKALEVRVDRAVFR